MKHLFLDLKQNIENFSKHFNLDRKKEKVERVKKRDLRSKIRQR